MKIVKINSLGCPSCIIMNKVFNIAGRILLGVCIYGAYRKTYEWGKEYMAKDIHDLKEYSNKIVGSIKKNKEA